MSIGMKLVQIVVQSNGRFVLGFIGLLTLSIPQLVSRVRT